MKSEMSQSKATVYSAIMLRPKEVSIEDAELYLSCKFYKKSLAEAEDFAWFYKGIFADDPLEPIFLLCNLFNCREKLPEIEEEIKKSRSDLVYQKKYSGRFKYRKIIKIANAMRLDDYPKGSRFIDDIIIWAEKNKFITRKYAQSLRKKIQEVRNTPLFSDGYYSEKVGLDVINDFLETSFSTAIPYIYQFDVRSLFSPHSVVHYELKNAVFNEEVKYAHYTSDIIYYQPKEVIKWLMRNHHFPATWYKFPHFSSLNIEQLDENTRERPETLDLEALKRMLREDYPGYEDVVYHVENNIYGAYIRIKTGLREKQCRLYQDQLRMIGNNKKIDLNCRIIKGMNQNVDSNVNSGNETEYIKRFRGLERLIAPSKDKNALFMQLIEGTNITKTLYRLYVELDVTFEECNSGLVRSFHFKEPQTNLSSADLRFIKNEVIYGMAEYIRRQKVKTGTPNIIETDSVSIISGSTIGKISDEKKSNKRGSQYSEKLNHSKRKTLVKNIKTLGID